MSREPLPLWHIGKSAIGSNDTLRGRLRRGPTDDQPTHLFREATRGGPEQSAKRCHRTEPNRQCREFMNLAHVPVTRRQVPVLQAT